MLIAYLNQISAFESHEITSENQLLLREAVWIDLISPTKTEEALVESHLNLMLPTRKKMAEIESSSRLYKQSQTIFMTATSLTYTENISENTNGPKLEPISFVITPYQLVTIRYAHFSAFKLFISHIQKTEHSHWNRLTIFQGLLDALIDYLADTLELVSSLLDEYSQEIFRPEEDMLTKHDYRRFVEQIGKDGDLNTKVRESLMTLSRLVSFFEQNNEAHLPMGALSKDIDSLSNHAHFLSTKINFLLDATLGMVSIDQNNIIKIFSVAAVIFLPPTLVASIYGMNFWYIPELAWKYGYLFSIALIGLAAWLPYKYFKYKKWL